MMKRGVLNKLLALAVAVFVVACQQLPEDDTINSEAKTEALSVNVRSVEGEEIAYPLYIYAFAEDGQLVASQIMADSEDKMSMELEQGEYQIVAMSGNAKDYQWPKNPSLDDVIVWINLKGAETPLMLGRSNVEVSHSGKAMAEITLSYMVASLGVKLKDIPENVTDVQVTLLPLHSSLSFMGNYGGDSQSVKVGCTPDAEGVWKSKKVYIFPGNGKETYFSISFKMEDGNEVTYGYTYDGKPEANRHFNVTGNYKGAVVVGGSFDVQDWEGSIDVEFDFGASVESDDKDEEDGDDEGQHDVDLTGVPEIGTIWNGAIVADWGEADESGVELLLLSLDEWDATTSQVDDLLEGYSVNGISDWRLPTHEEALVLRARFSGNNLVEINELIESYDSSLYGIADGEDERYLCMKNDLFYSFRFVGGTTITKAGEKRYYYVRLVKSFQMSLD